MCCCIFCRSSIPKSTLFMGKTVDKIVNNIVDDIVDNIMDNVVNNEDTYEEHGLVKVKTRTRDVVVTIQDPESTNIKIEVEKEDIDKEDGGEPEIIQIEGQIKIGARRSLIERDRCVLKKLYIDKLPTLTSHEYSFMMLAELLICISAAVRLVLLNARHANLEKDDGLYRFTRVLYEIDHDASSISLKDLSRTHIILSSVSLLILLPNLFLLGLYPEVHISLILQFFLSFGTFVITSYNLKVLSVLHSQYENVFNSTMNSCSQRHTCVHASSSWAVFVTIILFVVTTLLRLLFRTKVRSFIVNLKCIGRFVELYTSRRGRDFLSLTMLLFLAFSLTSGAVILSKRQIDDANNQDGMNSEFFIEAAGSFVVVVWLLLLLWIYSQVHHRFTHTYNVKRSALDEVLAELVEQNIEGSEEPDVSKFAYCPVSKNPEKPVCSGQRIVGSTKDRPIN